MRIVGDVMCVDRAEVARAQALQRILERDGRAVPDNVQQVARAQYAAVVDSASQGGGHPLAVRWKQPAPPDA